MSELPHHLQPPKPATSVRPLQPDKAAPIMDGIAKNVGVQFITNPPDLVPCEHCQHIADPHGTKNSVKGKAKAKAGASAQGKKGKKGKR